MLDTDLKEKAPVEQSNSLNESETIFSQSLNNDFNESTTETKSETLNEQSEHMVDENEQLQEQQFQEQPFASTTENEHQQDETIDIVFHGANASLLSELKSKQPEDNRKLILFIHNKISLMRFRKYIFKKHIFIFFFIYVRCLPRKSDQFQSR